MLYDLWRQTAREYSDDLALHDTATGRKMTFAELAALADSQPASEGPIAFAEGCGLQFVVRLLAAWKFQKIFCPLEPGQPAPALAQAPPHPVVHLKITSATTGPGRMIAFSVEQLRADAANIVTTMGLRRDRPNLGIISLAHSYGFSNLVLPLVFHGVPLVLVESALPETLNRSAAGWQELALPSVPVLWRTWFEAGAIPRNVTLAISAGAPLPLSLECLIHEKLGLKIHNFYGSSECGGIAYDRTEHPRQDPMAVGTPMDNVSVELVEECVQVRSAAVGLGYWPEPEDRLGQGLFRTNDLAAFHDGQLILKGRASEVINVAGRKLSPEQVERVIRQHPAVADCVVFGAVARDPHRVDEIVAWVTLRPCMMLTVDELRSFVAARLPAWQVPREWRFLPSLPVNARGKLSRAECRKLREDPASGVNFTPEPGT